MKESKVLKVLVTNDIVRNFAYFSCNFPIDFIESVWSNERLMANHLREKLTYYQRLSGENYITVGCFMTWFMNLDSGNQNLLLDWIYENYRGV